MTLAEMIAVSRKQLKISREELAKKMGVPPILITCLEEPQKANDDTIEFFASVFGIKPEVFCGNMPFEQVVEKRAPVEKVQPEVGAETAKYPLLRKFILDPVRCLDVEKAKSLFGKETFSLAERNVVLYLSTTALYNFCDASSSSFAFESYLFKHHGNLLKKFEAEVHRQGIPLQELEERLAMARGDVFRCERIENIAILVLEDFAAELEEKLSKKKIDFEQDLALPFTWHVDDTLMKISIKNAAGIVLHEIKLLDVKGRNG